MATNQLTAAAIDRTAVELGNIVKWGGSTVGWRRTEKVAILEPGDTISDAITNVGANGVVILTADSASATYTVSTGITISNSGVSIIGYGNPVIQRTSNVTIFTVDATDVRIEGITFDSDANYASQLVTVDNDDCIISKCKFLGFDATPTTNEDGIEFSGTTARCRVLDCTFEDLDTAINMPANTQFWVISGCIINFSGTTYTNGIRIQTGTTSWTNHGVISGNVFIGENGGNPLLKVGATVGALVIKGISITGNVFRTNASGGCIAISLSTVSSSTIDSITITGNQFDSISTGIACRNARYCTINGNSFINTTTAVNESGTATQSIGMCNAHDGNAYTWGAWTNQTAAADLYNV